MGKKKKEKMVVGTLEDIPETDFISTGVSELDEVIGGFARKRISEVWGNPGVGKSYLLAKTMASLEGKTLYIDTEFALNKERLVQLGVDLKKVDYVPNSNLEEVTEFILDNIDKYDLVIIDTIAKFTPTTIDANKVGDASAIGLYARQIAHFEAKLRPRLFASNSALVCINQVRANFGSTFVPTKPAGAFAWRHAIDMSLKLAKAPQSAIKVQEKGVQKQVGHWVIGKAEKNRLGVPSQNVKFKVEY